MALAIAAAAVSLIAGMPEQWRLRASVEPPLAQHTASVRLLPRDAEAVVLPAGWHAVGEALPPGDARHAGRAAGLQLRHGCTWGVPGRDPYRGTAEQALQAAGLPAEAVRVLAQRIQRGESDGVVTLARDGIQSADGQRQFGRRLVASTYGMTLCFDTLVNFAEGHVERAPLFEFTSAEGRRYSVIVPDVCGNVGVIGESPPAGIVLGERAERTLAQAAPGTADEVAPPVAPQHAGPARASTPAGPRAAGAGGRTPRPAPPTGRSGIASPPADTAPTKPTVPTLAGAPEPPHPPPVGDPVPGAQPAPTNGDAPSPQDTPTPSPTTPPKPGDPTLPSAPAAQHTPPPANGPPGTPAGATTPPAVDPGPGIPPVPGDGDAAPPQDTLPPQPTVPPTPGGPTRPDAPEALEPPPPAPPEPPPPTPPEPPTWLTPAPPWGDVPPPWPAGPADPTVSQPVPAPGTLSTGLLGLAALVLSRRWRRRRPR